MRVEIVSHKRYILPAPRDKITNAKVHDATFNETEADAPVRYGTTDKYSVE